MHRYTFRIVVFTLIIIVLCINDSFYVNGGVNQAMDCKMNWRRVKRFLNKNGGVGNGRATMYYENELDGGVPRNPRHRLNETDECSENDYMYYSTRGVYINGYLNSTSDISDVMWMMTQKSPYFDYTELYWLFKNSTEFCDFTKTNRTVYLDFGRRGKKKNAVNNVISHPSSLSTMIICSTINTLEAVKNTVHSYNLTSTLNSTSMVDNQTESGKTKSEFSVRTFLYETIKTASKHFMNTAVRIHKRWNDVHDVNGTVTHKIHWYSGIKRDIKCFERNGDYIEDDCGVLHHSFILHNEEDKFFSTDDDDPMDKPNQSNTLKEDIVSASTDLLRHLFKRTAERIDYHFPVDTKTGIRKGFLNDNSDVDVTKKKDIIPILGIFRSILLHIPRYILNDIVSPTLNAGISFSKTTQFKKLQKLFSDLHTAYKEAMDGNTSMRHTASDIENDEMFNTMKMTFRSTRNELNILSSYYSNMFSEIQYFGITRKKHPITTVDELLYEKIKYGNSVSWIDILSMYNTFFVKSHPLNHFNKHIIDDIRINRFTPLHEKKYHNVNNWVGLHDMDRVVIVSNPLSLVNTTLVFFSWLLHINGVFNTSGCLDRGSPYVPIQKPGVCTPPIYVVQGFSIWVCIQKKIKLIIAKQL
jgi:hypothetical protein